MSLERVEQFQKGQRDTVSKLGAFISELNTLTESINSDDDEIIGMKIKRLQPLVGEFTPQSMVMFKFLKDFHYTAYIGSISSMTHQISYILANQTMPSQEQTKEIFKEKYKSMVNTISEAMMAIAQLLPPTIDVNIKANNPFSAYCFLYSVMRSSPQNIMVVDPYVDKSIFYRYLSDLPITSIIKIVSDSEKLKGSRLSEYESVETTYLSQYPNYKRKMFKNLHDRYLVCDGVAFALGGSIKDAASKSDFSIVQVSDLKRDEIVQNYA